MAGGHFPGPAAAGTLRGMCVIIHKPRGRRIPAHLVAAAAVHNGDGWGLMALREGEPPRIERHRDVDVAHIGDALAGLEAAELCLHLRQRTRGAPTLANAHPLRIDARHTMMHNGTLGLVERVPGRSDSWHLARHVLAPLFAGDPDRLHAPAFRHWFEARLTPANRVVVMDATQRRFAVFNHRYGVQIDGLWISGWHWIARAGDDAVARTRRVA